MRGWWAANNRVRPYALLRMLTGDGRRCVAVIEAYVDESGTHSGSPILSVAAYAGRHEQWTEFLSEWGEQDFHAKENQYDKLKPRLFDVIDLCKLEGIAAWVRPEEFNQHAAPELRSNLGNAYAVCAFSCAIGVCKWARENSIGPVSFVVEKGQPNAEYVERVLKALMDDQHYGIASVASVGKREFVQLVTADFLAHSRGTSNAWYDRLYKTGRVAEAHLTPELLEKSSTEVKVIIGRHQRERSRLKREQKHA